MTILIQAQFWPIERGTMCLYNFVTILDPARTRWLTQSSGMCLNLNDSKKWPKLAPDYGWSHNRPKQLLHLWPDSCQFCRNPTDHRQTPYDHNVVDWIQIGSIPPELCPGRTLGQLQTTVSDFQSIQNSGRFERNAQPDRNRWNRPLHGDQH